MKTIHLKIILFTILGIIALFIGAGFVDPSVETTLTTKEIKNPLVR